MKEYVRALQKTAHSTIIVSLPKEWVKKQKLQAKEKVRVVDTGEFLVISPMKKEKKKVRIRFDSKEKTFREIVAKYIQGAEEIVVCFSPERWKEVKEIREQTLRKLLGADVTEEKNMLIIEILPEAEGYSYEKAIRKMLSLLEWELDAFLLALEKNEHAILREIRTRDDEIDRLALLVERKIHTSFCIGEIAKNILLCKSLASKLESLGDAFESMAANLLEGFEKLEFHVLTKISRLFTELREIILLISSAFFDKNRDAANELIERGKLFSRKVFRGVEKESVSEEFLYFLQTLSRSGQIVKEIGECIIDAL